MFRTNFLLDDQSYLVVDYDHFSLTVWVLVFKKRKPVLQTCVRSFFIPEERTFSARAFERNFIQCCEQLQKKIGDLPREVCIFLDHGESLVTSTGYTFTRTNSDTPVDIDEINGYALQLMNQSEQQSRRLWHEDFWYDESDRRLLSLFLSHLALDKKHHTFPIGKIAGHISMKCLFFYGNKSILDGISRSIHSAGYKLLTCVPLPFVFLNHICNQNTLLDNHLHIHLGYDSTTVLLHLGKHVQEIQTLPFWWQIIDEKLSDLFSPLERESLLLWNDIEKLKNLPAWSWYQEFLSSSLRILFERFGLQWSFHEYTFSSQWPSDVIGHIVKKWTLTPWLQKNATGRQLWAKQDEHWLHYCNTLDPLFSVHPHPLIALVRSVFLPPYADK